MDTIEALRLVYELAEQNAIDLQSAEEMDMSDQFSMQQEALLCVHSFIAAWDKEYLP